MAFDMAFDMTFVIAVVIAVVRTVGREGEGCARLVLWAAVAATPG
jgi:hypothetical protein